MARVTVLSAKPNSLAMSLAKIRRRVSSALMSSVRSSVMPFDAIGLLLLFYE
jgi:hypothetical protein